VAKGRNWTLTKYLLARGADPEHCLWAAAWWEDLPVIELLLKHGAALDPVQEVETPLLHALKNGRYKAARLLLDRGANVNHQDSRGMTALHHLLARQVDARHIALVMKYDPRGDLTDRQGRSVSAVMARKRDPAVKKLAVEFDV
jgi:hypothetical protein